MKIFKKLLAGIALVLLSTGCSKPAPTPAPTLVGISVNAEQATTEFEVGEEFTYEGIVVTATYSDESSKAVTEYTVTAPDMTTVGEKDVVVTYEEKTTSYTITVIEAAVSYSAESVAADMNGILEAAGYSFKVTYDETYKEWGLAVNTGSSTDESQESLSQGASILASFLPDYATLVTSVYGDPTAEGYVDIFGDGSIYFRAIFATPDYAVKMDIIAYVYNGLRIAQLSIADIVA